VLTATATPSCRPPLFLRTAMLPLLDVADAESTWHVGGAACVVHAIVPVLFVRTASDAVKRLYGQMMARQPGLAARPLAHQQPEWQIEYEI